MAHLMKAEVALDAVRGKENFTLTCEDQQEAVQRLKSTTMHQ
jgi:hypothetical protein